MLSDRGIKAAMKAGELEISPFDENDIQPCSIDVHLDDELRDPITQQLHPLDSARFQNQILPGEFLLGSTIETVTVSPALAVKVEGRSSVGRLGLLVHITAGHVDPGFSGQITLELRNVSAQPISLTYGMGIAQLCVFRLSSPARRPYGPERGSHYQNQRGATLSWIGGTR